MEIREKFRQMDKLIHKEYDVQRETERMTKRHSRQLQTLQEQLNGSIFRKVAITATETFKQKLKNLLMRANAEGLYNQLTSFLTGKISEVITPSSEHNT